MIVLNDVTKIYKLTRKQMQEQKTKRNMKLAVDHVTLTIEPGEIFGLLGPNGAGKTTTLRCISTLLKPTSGEITVDGFSTEKNGEEVRSKIAFLTNEIKLDPQFSPNYLFQFFGHLRGMRDDQITARKEELFTYFGIQSFADKKVEELSTGMKQKASIAVSLVQDPDIIIFDEPTNGLDIITARNVTDYLKLLKEQGKLILISTHIMSEAQKLCDRLGIIIDGRLVTTGTCAQIMEETHTTDLEDAFFELYRTNRKEEA